MCVYVMNFQQTPLGDFLTPVIILAKTRIGTDIVVFIDTLIITIMVSFTVVVNVTLNVVRISD